MATNNENRGSDRGSRNVTRRELGTLAAGAALAALGVSPMAARAAADDSTLVTEIPANAGLIKAVQYVDQSAKAGEICSGCILWQGGDARRGKCPLFQQGVVSAGGWCSSWSPRPTG